MRDGSKDGFASPACGLHEADDAYQGYLTRAEIIPRLCALRVTLQALTAAGNPVLRAAAAGWDATLAAQLARLDAPPAADPPLPEAAGRAELLPALNALIPKVRDDALHGALRGIRDAFAGLSGSF